MATIVTRRGMQTTEFRLYFGARRKKRQQSRWLKNTTWYIRWDMNTLRPKLLCLSSGSNNFFPRAGFSHEFPRAVTPISTKVKGVITTSLKDFCCWTWGKRSYNFPRHPLASRRSVKVNVGISSWSYQKIYQQPYGMLIHGWTYNWIRIQQK